MMQILAKFAASALEIIENCTAQTYLKPLTLTNSAFTPVG
jgi:hypothetical protein